MKNLAATADRIARIETTQDYDLLRDHVDLWTAQDLDCVQLDILTAMVLKRIQAKEHTCVPLSMN